MVAADAQHATRRSLVGVARTRTQPVRQVARLDPARDAGAGGRDVGGIDAQRIERQLAGMVGTIAGLQADMGGEELQRAGDCEPFALGRRCVSRS